MRADESLDAAFEAARAGDEHAFVKLWRVLQPPLLRYLTVRGNDSPEDLAAETWLQVVRDLKRFDGGLAEFRAWLFTVARNRAIDHGRARAARPAVPVAEPPSTEVMASAEVVVMNQVSTESALALVATLPPEQAELVMLRVVAGLEVADVAHIVGKKPGTVRVGVHRALKALARELSDQETQEVT